MLQRSQFSIYFFLSSLHGSSQHLRRVNWAWQIRVDGWCEGDNPACAVSPLEPNHESTAIDCFKQSRKIQSSVLLSFLLLFGLWGYWHCGHSWPIVPASGDSENDCGEADWQGKPKFSEKTCPSATFVHHTIPHDQTRVWTRAAAVGSRRLTAWAMA
jgi:hypothetical protein